MFCLQKRQGWFSLGRIKLPKEMPLDVGADDSQPFRNAGTRSKTQRKKNTLRSRNRECLGGFEGGKEEGD